jgi:hypothetical protein
LADAVNDGHVAYIGRLHQNASRQLLLGSKTVLQHVGVLQVWIDRADIALQPGAIRRAGTDIAKVGVIELYILQIGLDIDLAEAHVALRPIVKAAESTANCRLFRGCIRKANAGADRTIHLEQPA